MERLSQPNDLMFERNLVHIARRGREVEVWIEGLPQTKVGFLAGMDDEFIQVCLTKTQTLSNIARSMIVSLDETGKTLGGLLRDTRGTPDEDGVKLIRAKISHFQNRASALIAEEA